MKTFINDLKVGEKFETVFLLKSKEQLKTKENKPYLKVTLADKSGVLEGRVWDNAEVISKRVESGLPVVVKGVVEQWKGDTQAKVSDIRIAEDGEYVHGDLIRVVENIDAIYDKIKAYLAGISDEWLTRLSGAFLNDEAFVAKFKKSPGAKSWHNAYIGGLAEHTWEVMFIVDKICELYSEADKDVAIMGAFLHDVGKTLEIDSDKFEYTLDGGLIGHLPLGFEILSIKIGEVDGFPEDLGRHLKHIVLSHHGEFEQQSPILPKTLEATIVYHADELVSQANAVKEIVHKQSTGEKVWSNYVSIKNRQYLLKKPRVEN